MKRWLADLIDEELNSHLYINESNEEFIQRICSLCIDEIEQSKGFAPYGFGQEVVEEIKHEITEIFRMKTYGYYSLIEFRKKSIRERSC